MLREISPNHEVPIYNDPNQGQLLGWPYENQEVLNLEVPEEVDRSFVCIDFLRSQDVATTDSSSPEYLTSLSFPFERKAN